MKPVICAKCGDQFEVTNSVDEDAKAEAAALFPESDMTNAAVVCSDCYADFLAWMKENNLSGRESEDKRRLRRRLN